MVEFTEQGRKCGKSTAEAHGSLSLGLFATALLPDALWQILSLVILGALFAISSIYLILPYGWKRKGFLKKVATFLAKIQIKNVAWFLGFAVLGISLIRAEADWLVVPGVICACLGYAILLIGNWKLAKNMGSKGEKALA